MAEQTFVAVSRVPLSLLVARQLREAIISGQLAVGEQLPAEKDLTEQFGVSRSTVREALRILQAQGLLSGGETVSTTRPRVVPELTTAGAAEALQNAVSLGQIPLADLVELRLLLEESAIRTADPDAPALDEAAEALLSMSQPDIDVDTFHAQDLRFHLCLARASTNVATTLVMSVLREAMSDYLLRGLAAFDDPRPVMASLVEEHTQILEAVRAGTGKEAADLIRGHITGFYRVGILT